MTSSASLSDGHNAANKLGVLTIFYDGPCPRCTAEKSVHRKCAGAEKVALVDVSDPA